MAEVRALRPVGLRSRGAALWSDLARDDQPVARAVLLGEACRLADRLDRLDRLLRGDVEVWARLEFADGVVELRIDAAAAEARNATNALRQLLAQLTSAGEGSSAAPNLADELERRRAARRAGTEG